jgi:hypothetical protein
MRSNICKWEDDPVQSKDIEYAGGANRLSLAAARKEWMVRVSSDKR